MRVIVPSHLRSYTDEEIYTSLAVAAWATVNYDDLRLAERRLVF